MIGGTNFRRLVALKDALASPCESRSITEGTVHFSIAALPESRAIETFISWHPTCLAVSIVYGRNLIVLRVNCESCLVAVSR